MFEQIRPIVEAEAEKHRVEVAVDVPPGLPPIEGDATLLEQAFLNLALNACQAMPEGGRLTLTAQAAPARRISIDVEDTGTGIAPEHLSKIFDLYFTTKPHGSGIGLSLVFRTVQLHNGEIEVQSTLGHGTRFRIHLNQAAQHVPGPRVDNVLMLSLQGRRVHGRRGAGLLRRRGAGLHKGCRPARRPPSRSIRRRLPRPSHRRG